MELRYIGGVYSGNIKPAPFLCLTLKMLQIQPEKDIVIEFIKNEDFKYVRALGAFYLRLIGCKFNNYHFYDGRSLDLLLQHPALARHDALHAQEKSFNH